MTQRQQTPEELEVAAERENNLRRARVILDDAGLGFCLRGDFVLAEVPGPAPAASAPSPLIAPDQPAGPI